MVDQADGSGSTPERGAGLEAPDESRPTPRIPLPSIEDALRRIEDELALVSGKPSTVAEACAALAEELADPSRSDLRPLVEERLARRLQNVRGELAHIVFTDLERSLRGGDRPAILARLLLRAREPELRQRAAAAILSRWTAESRALDTGLAEALAAVLLERREDGDDAALDQAAALWRAAAPEGASGDPLAAWLVQTGDQASRRLAALILDRDGQPVPGDRLETLLGSAAATTMRDLLQYTRASHADLIDLLPDGRPDPSLIADFAAALDELGPSVLGAVIGELGWRAFSCGVWVERRIGLCVDGGFPLLVSPDEADRLARERTVRRLWDQHLVVAHGGLPPARPGAATEDPAVARFRRYNLLHAELLGEILEFAPVTPAKVTRILRQLDEVVEHFVALFADHAEEAGRLPGIYAALREPVAASCEGRPADEPLDAETTRLVQMFEDPRRLDEAHTLHGLKRYLHQRGLRLAFRRFRSGRATNRTIDLAAVAGGRVTRTLSKIRYIDFEPVGGGHGLPFFPALAVEALGRRLLHGLTEAPDLEILIYGNEIQTFVEFRNHPAFLRIDLSPPLRGGMIDLEYFGVSQYELEHHPDLSLPWIQRIFRHLDFDASADGLRLHIRYDKERAVDLADLIRGVRLLCSLLPHLMELDWYLGRLRYPEPVREAVADRWAEWIEGWGILPLSELLTADRQAILQEVREGALGGEEVPWDGRGPVRDRFAGSPGPSLLERLVAEEQRPGSDDEDLPRRFARLLAGGGEAVAKAARLAAAVASVERHLRFATVGSIQGYPVQRGSLVLPGEVLDIAVLRDAGGIIRLASVRQGPMPLRPGPPPRRDPAHDAAQALEPAEFMALLRSTNYVAPTTQAGDGFAGGESEALARLFATTNPLAAPAPGPGERTLTGIVAAPGKATGVAVFHRPGLEPQDAAGCVLFAPALRPEDSPLLRRAAAVVSTGGGILSHAGLIAQELGKPALVVEGRWRTAEAGRPALICRTVDYREEQDEVEGWQVASRRDRSEREEVLCEGDLVVVDADLGFLGVLGQDRDALALQEELQRLDAVFDEMRRVQQGRARLAVRGRLLHTTHQLRRLLARLDRPVLARHAAHELLQRQSRLSATTGGTSSDEAGSRGLLHRLFENPRCGAVAREAAVSATGQLERRQRSLCEEALAAIAGAETGHEVLFLRRAVQRLDRSLFAARQALAHDDLGDATGPAPSPAELDMVARDRLAWLRTRHLRRLEHDLATPASWWRLRTGLRALAELDALLGPTAHQAREASLRESARAMAMAGEQRALARLAGRAIVGAADGGLELQSLIGAKAAGLGEIARIVGPDLVAPWFAVSDAAFRGALAAGIGRADAALGLRRGMPLLLAVRQVLEHPDLGPRGRAAAIREMWRAVDLPRDMVEEIGAAYRSLVGADDGEDGSGLPMVAIRSSTLEEDASRCSWAGQFDTFLCVRGQEAVLEHLRLAWASLWSERALLYRQALAERAGATADAVDILGRPGGGVIVQRLVDSRAAGVLHTLSAASGHPREMVLNVGLGFGEGVVSGTVEVDQIAVSRATELGREPLRFRYTVGDKRTRVVCDRRRGQGTGIEPTLYHQRLRPALEYTDLDELVKAAVRLESAHAEPLDIEFAFEADRLYVLQARPIVVFQDALREACEESPWR